MKISKEEKKKRDDKIYHLFFIKKEDKGEVAKQLDISIRTVERYLEKYPKKTKKVFT